MAKKMEELYNNLTSTNKDIQSILETITNEFKKDDISVDTYKKIQDGISQLRNKKDSIIQSKESTIRDRNSTISQKESEIRSKDSTISRLNSDLRSRVKWAHGTRGYYKHSYTRYRSSNEYKAVFFLKINDMGLSFTPSYIIYKMKYKNSSHHEEFIFGSWVRSLYPKNSTAIHEYTRDGSIYLINPITMYNNKASDDEIPSIQYNEIQLFYDNYDGRNNYDFDVEWWAFGE